MFITSPRNKHGALRLNDFVVDGALRIPRFEWNAIKEEFEELEIRREISSLHERLDLTPPIYRSDPVAAIKGWHTLLNSKVVPQWSQNVFSRHQYRYDISNWYLPARKFGNVASDFFHRYNRMQAAHVRFRAPAEVWSDIAQRIRCLKPLFTLQADGVNPNTIEAAIALRSYIASQFKPCIAKTVYEIFQAEDVLDPSSGWGDRFAGFSAASCTKSYTSTDPNLSLYEGYHAQGISYGTGKAYDFIPSPFETSDLKGRTFDLAFTSPPYFNTEVYSQHEGQSWKKYSALDSWLQNFLLPSVRKAWKHLRPGGYLAMNIADLGTAYEDSSVCDAMNDCIAELPKAHYLGCMGMQLASRPSTSIDPNSIFVEPIWIWQKSNNPTTLETLIRSYL